GAAVAGPQRGHLRPVGAARRRRGARRRRRLVRVRRRRRHARRERRPLGQRLLVALRPLPARRHERGEPRLPRAPRAAARGDAWIRSAPAAGRRGRALRPLCGLAGAPSAGLRGEGAVPPGRAPQPAPRARTSLVGALSDVLVLCYHAVSGTWPAALSVTP